MKRTQTVDEEQHAQGKKDIGEFYFPIYAVSPKYSDPSLSKEETLEFIEAERFSDARSFGIRLFGVAEVHIQSVEPTRPYPRWQVKWAGHAVGSPTLRMQARRVMSEESGPKFADVRDM